MGLIFKSKWQSVRFEPFDVILHLTGFNDLCDVTLSTEYENATWSMAFLKSNSCYRTPWFLHTVYFERLCTHVSAIYIDCSWCHIPRNESWQTSSVLLHNWLHLVKPFYPIIAKNLFDGLFLSLLSRRTGSHHMPGCYPYRRCPILDNIWLFFF